MKKSSFSRRDFMQSGVLVAAACATCRHTANRSAESDSRGQIIPGSTGVASYTFRQFTRAQMIGFLKQLSITGLNAKDVKDHLPMDPAEETRPWPTTPLPASAARCRSHLLCQG